MTEPRVARVTEIIAGSPKSFDEAIKIVENGAKILHPRCIRLASKNDLPLHVLSFYDPALQHHSGTLIGACEQRMRGDCVFEGDHG